MVDIDDPNDDTTSSTGRPAGMAGGERVRGSEAIATPRGDPIVHRFHWTRVLGICLLAFLLWLLLDAPTLQHNAEVSPLGARRTVALDILGPLAGVSRALQLSRVLTAVESVVGIHGEKVGRENGTFLSRGPAGSSHKIVITPTPGKVDRKVHRDSPPAGATTTTTVPAWQHPTAATPLRVLIIGDSLGIDLGDPLVNDLSNTGVVQATLDGVESTGLSRPDYYNWPAELHTDLSKFDPQLVVIMIGANDPQDIPTAGGAVSYGTPQWDQVYGQRVAAFMAEASSQGARVIWVGMPPMQDPGLSSDMAHLDALYQAQAAKNPNVTYVSSWTVLGTPQGQYTPFIESGGQEVNVRAPDGTHISPAGGEVLSQDVIAVMRTQLHISLPG